MDANEQIFREIRSKMGLKGVTFQGIATRLEISRQQVWHVAKGIAHTAYIRRAIAEAVEYEPWPDKGN